METKAPLEHRCRLSREPVEGVLPDDIEHWRSVYQELLTAIDEMLARPDGASASPDGRDILRSRREELARGLEHWRTAAAPAPPAGSRSNLVNEASVPG